MNDNQYIGRSRVSTALKTKSRQSLKGSGIVAVTDTPRLCCHRRATQSSVLVLIKIRTYGGRGLSQRGNNVYIQGGNIKPLVTLYASLCVHPSP